ncbi:MAG TPA: hypothetical protein VM096_17760, partial [Vicinamibacterales bacterium]|nr:hypothetical protein [Vicinamibacterales bacterium]
RILRIAGDSVSVRDIAATMTEISGRRYRPLWAGGLQSLGVMINISKLVAPQPAVTFPAWQGMQYMRDQFSGLVSLTPLDNNRYPGVSWTSVRRHLAALDLPRA